MTLTLDVRFCEVLSGEGAHDGDAVAVLRMNCVLRDGDHAALDQMSEREVAAQGAGAHQEQEEGHGHGQWSETL